MLHLRWATILTLMLLCISASPAKSLQAFTLRAASRAVNSNGHVFEWPAVRAIDAALRINVAAPAKADVLLIVVGPDGQVLSKRKQGYSLSAGLQELVLNDIFATTDVMGRRQLIARVQLTLKGQPTEEAELQFEVGGPPAPSVEIEEVRLYSPADTGDPQTRNRKQFKVGAPFMFEARFNISDNPSGIKPRFVLLASMDEDSAETGVDVAEQYYDQHWDFKPLEVSDGRWRVIGRGALPYYFAQPWESHHPFKVYAIIDFGGGARTLKFASAEVFDYQTGEDRRSDDVRQRLITLGRAGSWAVSAAEQPVGNGVTGPDETAKYRQGGGN